ncbi:hypothetical protein FE391_17040 [Nonomuraea sp. KC401]|uniref:GH-E family nuclease n=1 Tax=unclassified Nonomuraea TaxID=2593643 RepID=UPI0010FD2003|nr:MULTISPECIES: GH-E family nuclease [unclassified Nonomuraea]NBE95311.1 hypothetical protein [Nonomuraea sp. K271]TLF72406.1 hypothetical protein FE391_17040 [Nonomuraea sp. KC401]
MTVPSGLTFLFELAGIDAIPVDEEEMRADAEAWRVVASHVEQSGLHAGATVARGLDAYEGMSATELASHWQDVSGNGGDLRRVTSAAANMPPVLDTAATIVTAGKAATMSQLVHFGQQVAPLLLAGGAAGAYAFVARRQALRRMDRQIKEVLGRGIGTRLASMLDGRVRAPLQGVRGWQGNALGRELAGAGGHGGLRISPYDAPRVGPTTFNISEREIRKAAKDYEKRYGRSLTSKELEQVRRATQEKPASRPYLRKSTRDQIQGQYNSKGELIDPNTKKPIQGKPDIGHKPGYEAHKLKDLDKRLRKEGLSSRDRRKLINEVANDPKKYQFEDRSSNRSHRYEGKKGVNKWVEEYVDEKGNLRNKPKKKGFFW